MDFGTGFDRFKRSDLAGVAVQSESFENCDCFRMFAQYLADSHFLGDHPVPFWVRTRYLLLNFFSSASLTAAGTKVAHLSLATNRRAAGGGDETKERTDWHRLTLWNRLAQFAQDYVCKGDRIYVEGQLEYDSYERDGITIPTADVNVKELVLLSPKRTL